MSLYGTPPLWGYLSQRDEIIRSAINEVCPKSFQGVAEYAQRGHFVVDVDGSETFYWNGIPKVKFGPFRTETVDGRIVITRTVERLDHSAACSSNPQK